MAKQLQLRRGTTSEHATFTGAIGEITVDTTKDVVVVHDGTTVGGKPLATEASVTSLSSSLATVATSGSYNDLTDKPTIINNLAGLTDITITAPTDGQIMKYNSTSGKWENAEISGGATGGGTDKIFVENGQTVTTSYTIPSGSNAMSTGDLTINTGVTVTVPSGSRWVII